MKRWVALIGVVVLVGCASVPAPMIKEGTTFVFSMNGGLGAGVCIDPDGYVLTAYHVIVAGGDVYVSFPDIPKVHKAEVVHVDVWHDLALLKVPAGQNAVKIGDSDAVGPGDPVWVCGHSGGLGWMTTRGIVSARKWSSDGQEYLLTDSWGWFGNSGGGLFNSKGELIGIVQMSSTGYLLATTTNWFVPAMKGIIHAYECLDANRQMLEDWGTKWREANPELANE